MKLKRVLAEILATAITLTSVTLPSYAVGSSEQELPETAAVTADREEKQVELAGETWGDFKYSVLYDGTIEITGYNGSDTELKIPSEIDGKKVTSIGKSAFRGHSCFTSVIIPNSVTSICYEAFSYCHLTSLVIPDSVTRIDGSAFFSCEKLKSVKLGKGLQSIGVYAFANTYILNAQRSDILYIDNWLVGSHKNVNHVDIKEGTIGIADDVFSGNSLLESVNIPDSVKIVGTDSFRNTPLLNNQTDKIKYVGEWVAFVEEDIVGDAVIRNGTKGIANSAFFYCNSLNSVTLPESVRIIGERAFQYCWSLKEINLPAGITDIRNGTFFGCSSLISLNIPYGVTSISDMAIYGCDSLFSVTIPDSVTSIGIEALFDCDSLSCIAIPKSVKSIGNKAFGYFFNMNATIKVPEFRIFCCKGTAGEEYAKKNGFEIVLMCEQHTFGKREYTKPTCTEAGYNSRTCSVCGYSEITVTDIPKGHFFSDDWTTDTEPTCTDKGYKSRHCVNCDEKTDVKEIPATGHNYSAEWTTDVEPTCTEDGYASRHCANCDDKADIIIVPATGHTFVDTNVPATYTEQGYTLHECSDCGYSYKDNETPKRVLAKITGFKASSKTDTTINLRWNKNSEATGYIIEQYKGNKWVRIDKITDNDTTTYKVTGLTATSRNAFRIQGYKEIGSGAVKSAYTGKLIVYTNPENISGFKASSKSDSVINLTWAKNSTATGYILEQYNGNKWVRIAKITSNATTTYKVTGLSAASRNVFRIQAYKEIGSGAVKSAYTNKLVVYTNPKAMSGFKASAKTKDSITLSWDKNTTATGYIVEQYKGGKWVRIAKLTKNSTTSLKVTGLKANTRYVFRIQAYKNITGGAVKSAYTNKLAVYTSK